VSLRPSLLVRSLCLVVVALGLTSCAAERDAFPDPSTVARAQDGLAALPAPKGADPSGCVGTASPSSDPRDRCFRYRKGSREALDAVIEWATSHGGQGITMTECGEPWGIPVPQNLPDDVCGAEVPFHGVTLVVAAQPHLVIRSRPLAWDGTEVTVAVRRPLDR